MKRAALASQAPAHPAASPMKRKAQKASTYARVFQAAKECFADRDVREVSMNDIAAHAGTSVGTLYVHFPNREALMGAVLTELQSSLISDMRATLVATDDRSVGKTLKRLAHSYVRALRDSRPYMSLYASQMASSMSVDALRTGGVGAPLVQMVNVTLVTIATSMPVQVDMTMLAASLVSLWRGAAISYANRPLRDETVVAESLATLTESLLRGAAPKLLDFDARRLAQAMAQYLK